MEKKERRINLIIQVVEEDGFIYGEESMSVSTLAQRDHGVSAFQASIPSLIDVACRRADDKDAKKKA